MQLRTDLALEQAELYQALPKGVASEEYRLGEATITKITIKNEQGARALGRPAGIYTTLEMPPLSDNINSGELAAAVARCLAELLPPQGDILVVGLGNRGITPDALGPRAAEGILATRQLTLELRRLAGLTELRNLSVVSPGVMGQTGIDSQELLRGIAAQIKPNCVIAIDALASRYLRRLGCTVQLSDTGTTPGSGVGNARGELSKATLGLPVIALGIPTVVDAATLVCDLTEGRAEPVDGAENMIVTPREIDLLICRGAALLSQAVNRAVFPTLSPELIAELLA